MLAWQYTCERGERWESPDWCWLDNTPANIPRLALPGRPQWGPRTSTVNTSAASHCSHCAGFCSIVIFHRMNKNNLHPPSSIFYLLPMSRSARWGGMQNYSARLTSHLLVWTISHHELRGTRDEPLQRIIWTSYSGGGLIRANVLQQAEIEN